MKSMTLDFGGQVLHLQKSEKLVALRPARHQKDLRAHIDLSSKATLNGFELYEVPQDSSPDQLETTLDTLRRLPEVELGSHVYTTSDDQVPFVPTGELFIKFLEVAPPADCQKLIDQHSLIMVEAREDNEYVFKTTALSDNPVKVAIALQQQKDVIQIAEPSFATTAKLQGVIIPDDTLIRDQWHLENTGFHRNTSLSLKKGADARVIRAWSAAESLGSASVVVAVIDDGFDMEHPDLYGVNKMHMPWDFTRNNNQPVPGANDWHGTSCAGVAVGNTNSSGIVGAAPNCKLMPIRWGAALSDSEVERWFKYVADNGASVVSCSWGASAQRYVLSYRMQKAISECSRKGRNGKGIVICFAAANSNWDINAPDTWNGFATHPDVLAVAACTSMDTKSHYSCFGRSVFITAPSSGAGGMGILTSDVRGNLGYAPGDYTYDFGGTSSATPLVAGICALMLSVNPELTAPEIKDVLRTTARKIGTGYDSNGHSVYYGYGCVDAEAAISAVKRPKQRAARGKQHAGQLPSVPDDI